MSYLRKFEYRIVPEEAYAVWHNCGGCGCKSRFVNTKRFRVNANGNKLDVWLIYQCEKCKHTLNLTIYERREMGKIPPKEYNRFLQNDEALALEMGRDYGFFSRNRLEVDWMNVSYHIFSVGQDVNDEKQCEDSKEQPAQGIEYQPGDEMVVSNPYGVRVRAEKVAGQLLNVSRSRLKKMLEQQQVMIEPEGNGWKIKILKRECGYQEAEGKPQDAEKKNAGIKLLKNM